MPYQFAPFFTLGRLGDFQLLIFSGFLNSFRLSRGTLGSCHFSKVNLLVVGVLVQEPTLNLSVVAAHTSVKGLYFLKLRNRSLVLDVGLDVVGHPRNGQTSVSFLVLVHLGGTLGDGKVGEILVQLSQLTKFLGGGVLSLLGESLSQGDGVVLVVNV